MSNNAENQEAQELDAAWDELAAEARALEPSHAVGAETDADLGAVDDGWELEPSGERPTRSRRRKRAAANAGPNGEAAPRKAVAVLDVTHRALSKKERRELERQQRAYAKKQEAERKDRARLERQTRRRAELDAANARARELAERARSEAKVKTKRPRNERPPAVSDDARVPAQSAESKRALRESTASKQASRARVPAARPRAALQEFAPWLFAAVVLGIVLFLTWLRR